MFHRRQCGAGSFFSGMVFGGLVGAVLALLYAPQSGEKTRKILKEKAEDYKDKALEKKKEAFKKAEVLKKDLAKSTDDIKKRAERAVKEFKKEAAIGKKT